MLFVVLAAALQQTPYAERKFEPYPSLIAVERELEQAPRGWPTGPTVGMVSSMVGATVFGTSAFAMVVGFPRGIPGFRTMDTIALFSALLASAAVSVISATVSFIVAEVVAIRRRVNVERLEARRERAAWQAR
ncbi:MAG: hypothetical protein QM817_16210 [Archangium sp.]